MRMIFLKKNHRYFIGNKIFFGKNHMRMRCNTTKYSLFSDQLIGILRKLTESVNFIKHCRFKTVMFHFKFKSARGTNYRKYGNFLFQMRPRICICICIISGCVCWQVGKQVCLSVTQNFSTLFEGFLFNLSSLLFYIPNLLSKEDAPIGHL